MHYNNPSFSDVYSNILENIRLEILKDTATTIIGTTTDELANYYYAKRHYDPIEIDTQREEALEQKNEVRIVPAERRDFMYRNEGDLPFEYESIKVTIPIVPHPNLEDLLKMRPSTFSLSGAINQVTWKSNVVEFTVDIKGYSLQRDDQWVVNEVQRLKKYVYDHIHIIKTEIETENVKLLQYKNAYRSTESKANRG